MNETHSSVSQNLLWDTDSVTGERANERNMYSLDELYGKLSRAQERANDPNATPEELERARYRVSNIERPIRATLARI